VRSQVVVPTKEDAGIGLMLSKEVETCGAALWGSPRVGAVVKGVGTEELSETSNGATLSTYAIHFVCHKSTRFLSIDTL
jgi:hypothetical protein